MSHFVKILKLKTLSHHAGLRGVLCAVLEILVEDSDTVTSRGELQRFGNSKPGAVRSGKWSASGQDW